MTKQLQSFSTTLPNPMTPAEIARTTGSHYSHEHAQSLGFKRATVGGVIVGHVMVAVADAWGPAWFERGEHYSRQRQPVYADDEVQVAFSALRQEDRVSKCDYQVINPDGVAGVVGWVALHDAPTPPVVADYPATSARSVPLKLMGADNIVGERLASEVFNDPKAPAGQFVSIEYRPGVIPAGRRLWTIPPSLRATHPSLAENTLVPWMMSGGSAHPELDYEGSNILAVTEGVEQFFNIATLDDELTSHRRISDVFERKGSRYYELETLVVANGRTPIVREKVTRLVHLVRREQTA